jgi:predicted metal-dependent phosphotriesterase family hydrolase
LPIGTMDALEAQNVSDRQLRAMTVENPRRFFGGRG